MKFNCTYTQRVPLHKLVANPKNNNNHPQVQIDRLAKIIEYQGMRQPIVVSKRSGFVVKGHGRLEALKLLGWAEAPVDYQEYESEAQEYADMTADNEIARWAELDKEMFVAGLQELKLDDSFDMELFGIDKEIDPEYLSDLGSDADSDGIDDILDIGDDEYLVKIKCGDLAEFEKVKRFLNITKDSINGVDLLRAVT